MIRQFLFVLVMSLLFNACIGPFKKQPQPEPIDEPVIIMAPTESIKWDKIKPIVSDKNEIKGLLGSPEFIDTHKSGEDWYYSYVRSVDYAVISFPVSGHLVNHVQHIRYPEWK